MDVSSAPDLAMLLVKFSVKAALWPGTGAGLGRFAGWRRPGEGLRQSRSTCPEPRNSAAWGPTLLGVEKEPAKGSFAPKADSAYACLEVGSVLPQSRVSLNRSTSAGLPQKREFGVSEGFAKAGPLHPDLFLKGSGSCSHLPTKPSRTRFPENCAMS